MHMAKRFVVLLSISMIVTGLYATIAQVVIFREFFAVFCGNELCIGIIFGGWLFGVAFGALVAGKFSSGFSSGKTSINSNLNMFIITLFVMSFLLPLQVGLLRNFRTILGIPAGELVFVSHDSKYQNIVVGRQTEQYNIYLNG